MKTLSPAHKALIRRYLIWAYKSSKETFDRLERKTTQLMADERILQGLLKERRGSSEYARLVEEYRSYIAKKKEAPIPEGQYLYAKNRVISIEDTIKHFLGLKELSTIQKAYEAEFIRRIWESKDH